MGWIELNWVEEGGEGFGELNGGGQGQVEVDDGLLTGFLFGLYSQLVSYLDVFYLRV